MQHEFLTTCSSPVPVSVMISGCRTVALMVFLVTKELHGQKKIIRFHRYNNYYINIVYIKSYSDHFTFLISLVEDYVHTPKVIKSLFGAFSLNRQH